MLRFTVGERLAHWNHALSFLALFVTGMALVMRGVAGALHPETLKAFTRVHRGAGLFFTFLTVPLLLLLASGPAGEWFRSVWRFDRDDRTFLARFPREFFGLHVEMPDQEKFNAGEKVNSLLQIVGWAVMVATGWLLWFKSGLPAAVAMWALPVHSFTAMLLGAVVMGHIYLAVVYWHTRPGLSGMFSGRVPARWARGHYRKWFDRIAGAGGPGPGGAHPTEVAAHAEPPGDFPSRPAGR